MSKAIETKYLGPTNYRGSRIKAYEPDGQSVTISYDYGLNDHDLHKKAAQALLDKMNWPYEIIGGHTRRGMVWILTERNGDLRP